VPENKKKTAAGATASVFSMSPSREKDCIRVETPSTLLR